MVKFKKDKLKILNKRSNKQNDSPTNKILKKKLNIEKKVMFRKDMLLGDTIKSDTLVKKIKSKSEVLNKLSKKQGGKSKNFDSKVKKPKQKSIEKKKSRQKKQVYDTKLILSLMKKKFNENEDMGEAHQET